MIRMTAGEKRAWRKIEAGSYPIRDELARRQVDYQSLQIDPPPPLNNCFVNVPGRGRVKSAAYRQWRERAAWHIESQRPGRIVGPYRVKIGIRRASLRRDLDGFLKQLLDLLVECGITDDDRYLDHIELGWTNSGSGVQLVVSSASFGEAAA